MNGQDPLEEPLAQLSEIVPPQNVRDANREAVRISLERPSASAWWQKSMTVPIPVAIAVAVVLLLSISTHLFRPPQSRPSDAGQPVRTAESSGRERTAIIKPFGEYSETQRYLSGVGVIDRNITYAMEE